jgi:hypothetical protein
LGQALSAELWAAVTKARAAGQASFKVTGPLSEANQSNLGLRLLNNYYTVFDRS